MSGKAHTVCPKVKGGVYKGYVTAKIIRDCTVRFNDNIIDMVDMVKSTRKIIAMYAESLTIVLSKIYNLSSRTWKTATIKK